MYVGRNICATLCIWRLEDNLRKLILAFYRMGPVTELRCVLGGRILYLLHCL